MKIRTCFVSNSSSSSFIFGFSYNVNDVISSLREYVLSLDEKDKLINNTDIKDFKHTLRDIISKKNIDLLVKINDNKIVIGRKNDDKINDKIFEEQVYKNIKRLFDVKYNDLKYLGG